MSKDQRIYTRSVDLHGLTATRDSWLSTVTGLECFGVTSSKNATVKSQTPSEINSLYTARVDVSEAEAMTDFLNRGFRLIDTAVKLRSEPQANSIAGQRRDHEISVRSASESDLSEVEAIATSAFRSSRFHLDPDLPNAIADKVKREWARNLVLGMRGDGCLIALKEGRAVGFLGYLLDADSQLEIDLIAVEEKARGTGAGSAMVSAIQSSANQHGCAVVVATQIVNRGALRLYESLGFRFESANYVLHGTSRSQETP